MAISLRLPSPCSSLPCITFSPCYSISHLHIIFSPCYSISDLHIICSPCYSISDLHIIFSPCYSISDLHIICSPCYSISDLHIIFSPWYSISHLHITFSPCYSISHLHIIVLSNFDIIITPLTPCYDSRGVKFYIHVLMFQSYRFVVEPYDLLLYSLPLFLSHNWSPPESVKRNDMNRIHIFTMAIYHVCASLLQNRRITVLCKVSKLNTNSNSDNNTYNSKI